VNTSELNDDNDGSSSSSDPYAPVQSARLWRDAVWTARVMKNEDDEGWAVAMTRHGESEPALVAPWTMGRDKKNPKPLDMAAFNTWIKTANEILRRHEQQLHAQLHKSVFVNTDGGRIEVTLDIEPDDDNPSAQLKAVDAEGQELGRKRVRPDFKLSAGSAATWLAELE
jgi:hypothetical protein